MDAIRYRIDILNKCMSCSPGFNEYTQTTFGIDSFDDLNTIDLNDMFYNAITFVRNELKIMGILFTDGIEVDTEDEYIKAAIALRETFDKSNFSRSLSMSMEVKSSLVDLLNSDQYNPTLLITAVIEKMFELFPLSLHWGFLNDQRYIVLNNDRFIAHILAIINLSNVQETILPDEPITQQG